MRNLYKSTDHDDANVAYAGPFLTSVILKIILKSKNLYINIKEPHILDENDKIICKLHRVKEIKHCTFTSKELPHSFPEGAERLPILTNKILAISHAVTSTTPSTIPKFSYAAVAKSAKTSSTPSTHTRPRRIRYHTKSKTYTEPKTRSYTNPSPRRIIWHAKPKACSYMTMTDLFWRFAPRHIIPKNYMTMKDLFRKFATHQKPQLPHAFAKSMPIRSKPRFPKTTLKSTSSPTRLSSPAQHVAGPRRQSSQIYTYRRQNCISHQTYYFIQLGTELTAY